MAGTIGLLTINDPADPAKQASVSVLYDDQLRVTNLSAVNGTTVAVTAKIVGLDTAGNEDPNKTFALLLQPGQADQVAVPATGPKAIQLAVNAKGKVAGFSTYSGGG